MSGGRPDVDRCMAVPTGSPQTQDAWRRPRDVSYGCHVVFDGHLKLRPTSRFDGETLAICDLQPMILQ